MSLDKDTIVKRINGIQGELLELKQISGQDFEAFKNGTGFRLAQFHLHRALEGVLNISSHILANIPGAQATEYAGIARNMGKFGIVPQKFAEENLVKMAKYRNRLVHFYAEIEEKEMYEILHQRLGDIEIFLSFIKKYLKTN